MAILETHDVGKRYGRRNWAIRHVDIEVPDGSITALVGPNGAGKSTLIKAWVGFERPTARSGASSTASTRGATAARPSGASGYVPAVAVAVPRADRRRPRGSWRSRSARASTATSPDAGSTSSTSR